MRRTREVTMRLLRDIISQRKLRGGLDSKTAAVKLCVNLLAAVRMSEGREWVRNRTINDFVSEQRKLAGDFRLGPGLRADACRRLCVLAGYTSVDTLGTDEADRYTKALLVTESIPKASHERARVESIDDVLKRLGGA